MATDAERIVALEKLLERRAQNYDKHVKRLTSEVKRLKAQLAAERAKDHPCSVCTSMMDGTGI